MSSVIITQDEYTAINSTVEVLRAQLAAVTAERDRLRECIASTAEHLCDPVGGEYLRLESAASDLVGRLSAVTAERGALTAVIDHLCYVLTREGTNGLAKRLNAHGPDVCTPWGLSNIERALEEQP